MRRFTTMMALLVLAGCATLASISKSQDEGISSVHRRTYGSLDEVTVVSPKDIGKRVGATVCVLRVLTELQPERMFTNSLTCLLEITRNGEILTSDNALVYSPDSPQSFFDNAIPVRIEQQCYLLKMEQDGDRIKLDDATRAPVIGVGSQIRFGKSDWVPFLGSSYRGGGFAVTSEGFMYLQHTERQNSQGKAIYDGTDWLPIEE